MKKTSILGITLAIVGAVWMLAVVLSHLFLKLPWLCWGSIAGVAVAVGAAEIYLLVLRKDPGSQAAEQGALGAIFTVIYLIIALLANTLLLVTGYGYFSWLLIVVNIAILAGYIILVMWTDQASKRLEKQLETVEKKTAPNTHIARKLGELLAITQDDEIRGRLLKLKEAVDYSTNISTQATADREMQMGAQLDETAQLTIARADRLIILGKVETAEMLWKMRNATSATFR